MAPSGAPFGDFCRLHASLWQGGSGRRNLASRRQPGAGPERLIETSWPGAREVSGSRRMCAHPDLTLARGALAFAPELPPSLSPDPFDRIRRLVCVPLRHARWPLGSRLAQTIRGLNHHRPATGGRPLHPARRIWPATAAPSGAGSASPGSQSPVYPKAERDEYGTGGNKGDEMGCVLLNLLGDLEKSSP
jgi:hypothetical protein